ncbi:hypothetical protein LZ30DRAFT_715764 [Colletotrichum cereale]|nr:hypothetical protein LZ30DRAFT_715764 [Colletotrichum cereale]
MQPSQEVGHCSYYSNSSHSQRRCPHSLIPSGVCSTCTAPRPSYCPSHPVSSSHLCFALVWDFWLRNRGEGNNEDPPPVCDAPQPCKCVKGLASGIKMPRGCVRHLTCVCVCVCACVSLEGGGMLGKGQQAGEREISLVVWTNSRANDDGLMKER